MDIEQLNMETLNEINQQFIHPQTKNNQDDKTDVPLNFVLYDKTGNNVKMFSRSCKIGRSRELYEYFENNDAIKMKIN